MSLLLGVIQRSNKIIMDDKQAIFGRQSVSLPIFYVAENILHYLPNFVATWNPPLKVYLSAVKNQKTPFFSLLPQSLLLGVIKRSNKIIMGDEQPIFGKQSVSLPNFFVAENIVHYLPKFVATWNPPLRHRRMGVGAMLAAD